MSVVEPSAESRGVLATVADALKPHSASALLHLALVGIAVLTVPLARDRLDDVVEVELIDVPVALPQPEPPPEPPPVLEDKPLPPPPVEPERPEEVPDKTRVEKVDEPLPFHPRAKELAALRESDPPPDAVAAFEVPDPTPALEIEMEATVDGPGGVEVVAVEGRAGNVMADSRQNGTPGARGTPSVPTYVPDIELAESWQITEEPEPLNERDIDLEYPPGPKSRREEGAVVVRLSIDAQGRTLHTEIVRSAGAAFDQAAARYCKRLRFSPAKAGGEAVATVIEWEVEFRFRNE